MFCKYCGKEIDDTAKFCGNCEKIKNDKEEQIETNKIGFFNKMNQSTLGFEEAEIEKDIQATLEKHLKPRNGKKHIIAFKINALNNKKFNDRYNTYIEEVLEIMQDREYEIVGIKTEGIQSGNGYTKEIETIIIYK